MATVIVPRCRPLGVCDACDYHTAHVSKRGKSVRTTAPVHQIEAWLTTVLGQGDQINDNYSATRSPLLTSSPPQIACKEQDQGTKGTRNQPQGDEQAVPEHVL